MEQFLWSALLKDTTLIAEGSPLAKFELYNSLATQLFNGQIVLLSL